MSERAPVPKLEQLHLRTGGASDLDEVMRIMNSAFPACYGEAWTRSQCAGILPMKGVRMVLAERSGEAVGFALMRVIADEAELLLLAVEQNARGQGIGRALLDHFVDVSHQEGATRLHLEVRDGNSAVALYHAVGFLPAGRRANYYRGPDGDRHDALTLVLSDSIA